MTGVAHPEAALAVDFALDVVEQTLGSPTGGVDEVRAACRSFVESPVPYLESVTTPDGGVPIVVESLTEWDGHSMLNVVTYLGGVDDRDWAARQFDAVGARLADLPYFHLYPANGYGVTPLDVVPRPDDPGRALFPAAAVETHLDGCEATRTDDGGWKLTWEPPGPAAELEWRGVLAVRDARLFLLNARN